MARNFATGREGNRVAASNHPHSIPLARPTQVKTVSRVNFNLTIGIARSWSLADTIERIGAYNLLLSGDIELRGRPRDDDERRKKGETESDWARNHHDHSLSAAAGASRMMWANK